MGIPFYYLFHCIWTFFGSGGNYLPAVWNQVCMHSLQHASVNVITKVIWNSLLREVFFVCYSVICFPFAICIWFLFGLQYFEDFSKLCNCVITTCNNQAIMCLILYLNVVFLFSFFKSAWSECCSHSKIFWDRIISVCYCLILPKAFEQLSLVDNDLIAQAFSGFNSEFPLRR